MGISPSNIIISNDDKEWKKILEEAAKSHLSTLHHLLHKQDIFSLILSKYPIFRFHLYSVPYHLYLVKIYPEQQADEVWLAPVVGLDVVGEAAVEELVIHDREANLVIR